MEKNGNQLQASYHNVSEASGIEVYIDMGNDENSNYSIDMSDTRDEMIDIDTRMPMHMAQDHSLDTILYFNNIYNYFYKYEGKIIMFDRNPKQLRWYEPSTGELLRIAQRHINYLKISKDGNKTPTQIPNDIRNVITDKNVIYNSIQINKEIAQILRRPYVDSKGNVITKNGLNPDTKIYLRNLSGIIESDIRIYNNIYEAKKDFNKIVEIFSTFGFKSETDLENTLSCVVTIAMRQILGTCPIPFFMITKPAPSYGGTLLLQTIFALFDEQFNSAPFPYTFEECKNTLPFAENNPIMGFDDLTDHLQISPTMQQVLTSGKFLYRPLYKNEMRNIDIYSVLIGTGKEVSTGKEIARRTIQIEITRKDIPRKRYGNYEQIRYVEENRKEYEIIMLSLIKYYILNCSPKPRESVQKRDSFEKWHNTVIGFLDSFGYADNVLKEIKGVTRAMDYETEQNLNIFNELYDEFGINREFRSADVYDCALTNRYLLSAFEVSMRSKHPIMGIGRRLKILCNINPHEDYIIISIKSRGKELFKLERRTIDSTFDQYGDRKNDNI